MNTRDKLFLLLAVLAVGTWALTSLQAGTGAQSLGKYQMVEFGAGVLVCETETGRTWVYCFPGDENDPGYPEPNKWIPLESPTD